MNSNGKTLSITGPGLASGHTATVVLYQGNAGHCWFTADSYPILGAGVNRPTLRAERMTVLQNGEQILRMPEHLAAATLCWPQSALCIHAPQGEVPLRDGSAAPWFTDLQALLGAPQELHFYDCPLQSSWDYGFGYCAVEPNPERGLVIEASLSRGEYSDAGTFCIQTTQDLLPILQARTFIFSDDWESLRAKGMLPGALEGCGILLQAQGSNLRVLSGAPLRHSQEPLLHKILDLLGDLALLGPHLPKLRIRIHNGGHAVHHQLIERIQNYVPD